MEDKWADYLIYEVRFDAARTRSVRRRIAPGNGHAVDEVGEYLRDDVISAIRNASSSSTVFQYPPNGNWSRGERVFLSTISGVDYVKTRNSARQADDNGHVPRI